MCDYLWATIFSFAQLVVFKEESGGSTAVPQSWGKKMNKKFGVEEAPDWWSKALTTDGQPAKIREGLQVLKFKKPAWDRKGHENTSYAGNTTKRRVALLDGIGFFT